MDVALFTRVRSRCSKLQKQNENQSAFSLVELMIVVGIIGILAALAVPRFQTFQVKARQAEAKTNLSIIATLAESFAVDNNGVYPDAPALELNATDFSAVGSCNNNNVIGYKVLNCSAVRYTYLGVSTATDFDMSAYEIANPGIHASGIPANSRRVSPGCSDFSILDQWNLELSRTNRRIYSATDAATECSGS